jgi:hypothetical protein
MRKTWLILVLSFVVPFLIGGIGAWLWTENMSDNPHAGGGGLLSDKQIEEAQRQIDKESNSKFLTVGVGTGVAGLLLAGGILFMSGRFRRLK